MAFIVFLVAGLLSACGGGGPLDFLTDRHSVPNPGPVLIVTPNPIVLRLADTLEVRVAVRDAKGAAQKPSTPVSWEVGNSAIATIEPGTGVISAKSYGTTTLTVMTDGLRLTVPVTVAQLAPVNGVLRFQDKIYNQDGFVGSTYKTLRHVLVEAVGNDERILSQTATDSAGRFALNVPAGLQFRLRALARTDETVGINFSVRNRIGQGALYAATLTNLVAPEQGLSNLAFDIDTQSAAGAFNIIDVFTSAAFFIATVEPHALPALTAFWQLEGQGQGPEVLGGTFFCPVSNQYCPAQGRGIYVLQEVDWSGAGAGDNDEYDDDVLWHEFGHYLMDGFSRDDSMGGRHSFIDTNLDIRFAFSEGLGDFLTIAVKTWMAQTGDGARLSSAANLSSAWYVDTFYFNGGSRATALDIGTADTKYVTSRNEIAVAKVLYGFVLAPRGMGQIWPVLTRFFNGNSIVSTDLETFWDGWRALFVPDAAEIAQMQRTVLKDREIYFEQDAYEQGALEDPIALPSATVNTMAICNDICSGNMHTFYRDDGSADVDVVRFSVSNANLGHRYSVQTKDLSNGADTVLELYNSNGGLIQKTTHTTNAVAEALIDFIPSVAGDYYVRVSSPAYDTKTRVPGSGRYGTYWLRVVPGN